MPMTKKRVKRVGKKGAATKNVVRRRRSMMNRMATLIDASKNKVFKNAVARQDKALKMLERAEDTVQKAVDAVALARAKAKPPVSKNASVLRRKESVESAREAVADAKFELRQANKAITALAQFEQRQDKAYDRALTKAVEAQAKAEALARKKKGSPKKRRVTRKKRTAK